jgi:hypothetical protein
VGANSGQSAVVLCVFRTSCRGTALVAKKEGDDHIEEELELDEQERNLLRDFCEEADKQSSQSSRYPIRGGLEIFHRGEIEKVEIARSLEAKNFIHIVAKNGIYGGPVYSLTPKAVKYCTKLKKML